MSKILLVISLVFSVQSFAKVKCGKGVEFEEVVTIEKDNGKEIDLDLNGVGLKKVLFFNVFYVALYLEKNIGQSGDVILKSNSHKVGVIHALRNIKKDQLVNEWEKEFERLCGSEKRCKRLRKPHDKFLSYARDVKKGERLFLVSFPHRFEFEVNMNETYPPIYSPEYAKLLQNSLFGPDSADKSLKKGILG